MQNLEDIKVSIDEMIDLQIDCKELCHYTPIATLESIVNTFNASDDKATIVFRATSAFETNDRLEMQLGYGFTLDLFSQFEEHLLPKYDSDKFKISKYMNDVKNSNKFNRYSEDEIVKWMLKGENTPYIISLSRQIDNLDMWQKYGCNGYGVCLIFNNVVLGQLIEQSGMFIHGPLPVIYGERIGHIKMKQKFMRMVHNLYKEYLCKVHPLEDLDEIAELKIRAIDEICSLISVFIKNEDWHIEREYRIAAIRHFYPTVDQPIVKHNEKGKSFFEVKIPINSLTQIIIGPCNNETDIKTIKSFAKTLGLSDENVFKSNKPLQ